MSRNLLVQEAAPARVARCVATIPVHFSHFTRPTILAFHADDECCFWVACCTYDTRAVLIRQIDNYVHSGGAVCTGQCRVWTWVFARWG